MTDGVPVTLLCCPTCGAEFERVDGQLTLQRDDDDFLGFVSLDGTLLGQAQVKIGRPLYLRCVRDHRWSVKFLQRTDGEPDRVLLDRYLGGGALA